MKKFIYIGLLIIVIGLGIFFFYRSNEPSKETKNESQEKQNTELILKTKKDVIAQLKEGGVNATYIGEENECWKFEGDNKRIYTYCLDDGILTAVDKTN